MKCIYVGRLDKEKGIPTLIQNLHLCVHIDNFSIDLYGKGEYTPQLQQLAIQYPKQIRYHGRQHKSSIIDIRKQADFFLMPSVFLETFGLTAAESLSIGVPVIGYQQGGLEPFIHDKLNLSNYNEHHPSERIFLCLNDQKTHPHNYQKWIQAQQEQLSTEHRYTQRTKITKKQDSHNLISISDTIDYHAGGVETHIHDTATLLQKQGRKTQIYGHHIYNKRIHRLLLMTTSIGNIIDSIAICRLITTSPNNTILRRHSISRVIGRLPLFCSFYRGRLQSKNNKNYITYHELGLFHPYPSKVEHQSQIPQARSLQSFVQACPYPQRYYRLLSAGKYFLIMTIHRQLRRCIDTHIVPSPRMANLIKKRHPDAIVVCLGHSVQLEESHPTT